MSVLAAPFAGIGITLGAKPSGTGSFVPLVQIKDDMEFDGFDTTVINVPTLASTTMTKIPGRTDFGTLNCSMYLVNSDAGVADIMTLAGSKATVPWQVQLPDGTSGTTGTSYAFNGFVSNVKPGNFTGEDAPTLDITIAISGAVTVTAAT
jgi:hypothetical protein